MRLAAILAAVLSFGGRPVLGEVISVEQGPLALEGLHRPMYGPSLKTPMAFKRPGWVRGLSVEIFDSKGRPATAVLCHADLSEAAAPRRGSESRLSLTEGQPDMSFPEGYGLYVDPSQRHDLFFMLKSESERNNGSYSVRYRIDFEPKDGKKPVKTLRSLTILTHAPGATGNAGGDFIWQMPSGRHEYSESFTPAFPLEVHYLYFHLHQFATDVALIDAATGQVLFSAPVVNGPDGWPAKAPRYSDVKGMRLAAGRRYVYRTRYDNPEPRSLQQMSALRLYFAQAGHAGR